MIDLWTFRPYVSSLPGHFALKTFRPLVLQFVNVCK